LCIIQKANLIEIVKFCRRRLANGRGRRKKKSEEKRKEAKIEKKRSWSLSNQRALIPQLLYIYSDRVA
jgi:hypothetical protein